MFGLWFSLKVHGLQIGAPLLLLLLLVLFKESSKSSEVYAAIIEDFLISLKDSKTSFGQRLHEALQREDFCSLLYTYGNTYSKSMDQQGKVLPILLVVS